MSIHSWKLYAAVVSWLSFCIKDKVPKAERYIFGLEFAYHLTRYDFNSILFDYLRVFLDIKLSTAAKIVNVQEGLSSIVMIFSAHISDAYLGLFRTIVLANVFHLIGLLLFYTAAYVDSNSSDKKIILFVALFFLALGINGGRDSLLDWFLSDQRSNPTVAEEVRRVSWRRRRLMLLLSIVVSALLLYFVPQGWLIIITVVVRFAGLLCFWLGRSSYWKRPLTRGPLATTFHVFKAAIVKGHLKYPTEPSQCHENDSDNASSVSSPSSSLFRWIPSSISEHNDRLCTVAQVKEVKRLLTMIPMWTLFLVYSIVGAAGNTFFFEQSSSINDDFPLIVFVICNSLGSAIASVMCKILQKLQWFKARWRLTTLVQIGIGMLCSLSCCIVAWRVEKFRLSTKNMSVLWLIPQFVLLGCMGGFGEKGLSEFFKTQVSGSMKEYGPVFNEFVLGIGKLMSAILIVIFKEWFGNDVESSHLDRYYEFLSLLSLLIFFFFVFTAVWYGTQQVEKKNLIPIWISNRSNSLPPPPRPMLWQLIKP